MRGSLKKYTNPRNYLQWALAGINQKLLGHVESLLVPNPDEPLRHPPIFLLGAPRSGSTLITQAITDALDVGYISNCHCKWYGAPALADRLFRPLVSKPGSDYCSEHGATGGPYAPAECGEWWYRFFRRRPAYVTLYDVDPGKMQEFRRSIAALTNALDKPILFKNLNASLRIQAIGKYIPESLFVVIHRDEVDNGHSLLEARYKTFGNYTSWFSVEPPKIEALKVLPPHEQVIEQIRNIHMTINQDLKISGISSSRRFDLNYQEFCANPSRWVDAIHSFIESHGCLVKRNRALPKRFDRRDRIRVDQDLYQAMSKYARESLRKC